jgi:xanthine dehydrogenase accessory factor
MRELSELVVLIKGGGEVASGVAHKLHRSHFKVCLTEIALPLAVSRGTAFSEAVFDGTKTVESITAELVLPLLKDIQRAWKRGHIAVTIDPEATVRNILLPDVVIDATMAKHNIGTKTTDAPLVIGLGSGFSAGKDVHIVIETLQGRNLGRVITEGEAAKNTGEPVVIANLGKERVVWAPEAGTFTTRMEIGQTVQPGEEVGRIGNISLTAPLGGTLRGLIRNGVIVRKGEKLIEVDSVNDISICFVIRDKMRTIAGGVLEAIMMKCNTTTKSRKGASNA